MGVWHTLTDFCMGPPWALCMGPYLTAGLFPATVNQSFGTQSLCKELKMAALSLQCWKIMKKRGLFLTSNATLTLASMLVQGNYNLIINTNTNVARKCQEMKNICDCKKKGTKNPWHHSKISEVMYWTLKYDLLFVVIWNLLESENLNLGKGVKRRVCCWHVPPKLNVIGWDVNWTPHSA